MLKNLKQSDKILTNGGIIGKIIEIKQEDIILLEISQGSSDKCQKRIY